jgi:peptidoglycan/LPS O-acetylase OafA/YrhL
MASRRDPNGDFDRAFAAWARRPVTVTPEEAAGRVQAAIVEPRRRARLQPLLALAATVVLALAAWLALRPAAPPPAQQQAQLDSAIALEDDVVVWWLDPETPVYFSLPKARGDEGGVS